MKKLENVCGVSIEELEEQLRITSQAIYNQSEVKFAPSWPWVLVRVVPKSQKVGSLYLPDNAGATQQNKPLWEGIVLETWKPHWSMKKMPGEDYKDQREIWRESDFKRGDRVIFPHFAGLPVKYLDETHYRMVREWTFDVNGGILGKVDYVKDRGYKQKLDELFSDLESCTLSGE